MGVSGGIGGVWAVLGPQEFTLPDGFTPRCGDSYEYPKGWAPQVLTGVSFSFLCDDEGRLLVGAAQGGAIDEAYSDIIGTAVELMLHEPAIGPLRADYLVGEDAGAWFRRIDDPSSVPLSSRFPVDLRFPDASGRMVYFLLETAKFKGYDFLFFSRIGTVDKGRTLTWLPTWGYSGVHWNSTILSHAFYLAIEGGQNRTTGLAVQGVGGANRHDVERAFFRAMTDLMPSSPHMGMAASAIVQSASDLFGSESAVYRAIDEAMDAVGLLLPASR